MSRKDGLWFHLFCDGKLLSESVWLPVRLFLVLFLFWLFLCGRILKFCLGFVLLVILGKNPMVVFEVFPPERMMSSADSESLIDPAAICAAVFICSSVASMLCFCDISDRNLIICVSVIRLNIRTLPIDFTLGGIFSISVVQKTQHTLLLSVLAMIFSISIHVLAENICASSKITNFVPL